MVPFFHTKGIFWGSLVLLEPRVKERAVVPGGWAGLGDPVCSVVIVGILYKALVHLI